ncbi:MAG: VWA domain-containing protein [Pirellulales bacterium]
MDSGSESPEPADEPQVEAELARLRARVKALEAKVGEEADVQPAAEPAAAKLATAVVSRPAVESTKPLRSASQTQKPGRPADGDDAVVKPSRPGSVKSPAAEKAGQESVAPLVLAVAEPAVPKAKKAEAARRPGAEDSSAGDTDETDTSAQSPHWLGAYLFREGVPGWSVSTLLHAVFLLILALYALPRPEERDESPIAAVISEIVPEMEETEEEVELELDSPEIEQVEPDLSQIIEDVGAAELLGEMQQADTEVLADFGEISPFDDIADTGFDLAELGDGKGLTGDGQGMASFFGVKTKGRRFMFVVDNSNSMNNGKFETAVVELQKSISKLSYSHEFFIVFYSDTAYPLFYPRSAKTWVKATQENREKLRYWLKDVERCLQTRGIAAMTTAFKMKPDVIYLLGDGSFTDKAVPATLQFKDPHVVVHTMGFGMKDAARAGFEKIAAKYRGKFHEVTVTPRMRQYSKQVNRPRNNQRHGVWGVNLGAGKKKKK